MNYRYYRGLLCKVLSIDDEVSINSSHLARSGVSKLRWKRKTDRFNKLAVAWIG